jgi:hypothetical protein
MLHIPFTYASYALWGWRPLNILNYIWWIPSCGTIPCHSKYTQLSKPCIDTSARFALNLCTDSKHIAVCWRIGLAIIDILELSTGRYMIWTVLGWTFCQMCQRFARRRVSFFICHSRIYNDIYHHISIYKNIISACMCMIVFGRDFEYRFCLFLLYSLMRFND